MKKAKEMEPPREWGSGKRQSSYGPADRRIIVSQELRLESRLSPKGRQKKDVVDAKKQPVPFL